MTKQRKEVHLDDKIVKALTKLAKADNRKLKPYMEKVLASHAEQLIKRQNESRNNI